MVLSNINYEVVGTITDVDDDGILGRLHEKVSICIIFFS